MTKREYMNRLVELLAHCDEEYRVDILSAIEEHFAEGLAQGGAKKRSSPSWGIPGRSPGPPGNSNRRTPDPNRRKTMPPMISARR